MINSRKETYINNCIPFHFSSSSGHVFLKGLSTLFISLFANYSVISAPILFHVVSCHQFS